MISLLRRLWALVFARRQKMTSYQISGDVLGGQSTAELFRAINEGLKAGRIIDWTPPHE